MKRLIAFAAAFFTSVCLAACSVPVKEKAESPNGLNSSFSSSVSVALDEMNAEGTVKRFGNGMWEVEFSSPNTLSGVMLSFSEGNVTASYKGLNFSVPQSALPVKAMMLNLITAADDIAENEELSGSEKDGMIEISGSLDGGEYTLTVDKNGNIASFSMPGSKLKMTFSDVQPITGEAPAESTTAAVTEAAPAETSQTSAE